MIGKWLSSLTISIALMVCCFVPVYAAPDPLLANDITAGSVAGSARSAVRRPGQFRLKLSRLAALSERSRVELELPDGQIVSARSARLRKTIRGTQRKHTVLSLDQGGGSLELLYKGDRVSRAIMTRVAERIHVYESQLDSLGRGSWVEQDANQFLCIDLPPEPFALSSSEQDTGLALAAAPSESVLRSLQGKPAANKVLYVNFWGGTLSGTYWNETFNSDNDIVFSAYSEDADSNSFSATDRDRIWMAWREVVEDYAPFDVNVTTDQSVYDQTPSEDRSMIIATVSRHWYPYSVGGVANKDSFGNNYSGIGWVWNRDIEALGQTISHEAGHQMGLTHDGKVYPQYEYYSGHGVDDEWGPIMGAPYGKTFVQWSKGEYDGANNSENDLSIIAGVLGADGDMIGDNNATAQAISSSTYLEGTIQPLGLIGGMDTDVYRFELSSTQNVQLVVKPLLGNESLQFGSNLAQVAQLTDGSNSLQTSNQAAPYYPQNNALLFDGSLDAGSYYIVIAALSPSPGWSAGFGEYANAGNYAITLSSSQTPEPDLTAQLYVEDSQVYFGQAVKITAAINNIGSAAAAAGSISFYQSTDAIISSADIELAVRPASALQPLGFDYVNEQILVPDTAGTMYYGVCVNAVAGENVVSNNCSAAIEFTVEDPGLDLNIGDAVEQPALGWLRGGDASFYRETDAGYFQGDAARSGALDNDEFSWIQADFTGPGWVVFDWKVSSENTFDFLRFYDNGQEIDAISGELDWTQFVHEIDAGLHSLQWRYDKDPFTVEGQDAGWVDEVQFLDRKFSIIAASSSQMEGDTGSTAFHYTVASSGLSLDTASIHYTVNGSGQNPTQASDFVGGVFPSGVLNFAVADTEEQFTIHVQGDEELEADETFLVTLSNVVGGVLGNTTEVQSVILNDEDDIDGDGVNDIDDNCPVDSNADQTDLDGNGQGDVCDEDIDGDTVLNEDDNCPVDVNPGQADICTLCLPIITLEAKAVLICL